MLILYFKMYGSILFLVSLLLHIDYLSTSNECIKPLGTKGAIHDTCPHDFLSPVLPM